MSCEEEEGHIAFLQEGDSTVLSEEGGKEEVSFIETHPGFSNMADNEVADNEVESSQGDIEQQPKQHGDNSEDDDDDDDEDEDEEDQEA
jgi:hypothetical protein